MADTKKTSPSRDDIIALADYKAAWSNATTDEERNAASAGADAIRANTGMDQGASYGDGLYEGTKTEQELRDMAAGMDPIASGVPDGYNIDAISSIYGNMQSAQSAEIENARATAVSGYEEQMSGVSPEYEGYRSDVDVQTARNIQQQNESAAAKGTTFSGGVQSDAGGTRAMGTQQKTALTRDEASLVASIKRAIADTNKSASLQQVSSTADIQAQEAQALLENSQYQDQMNYQKGRDQVSDSQWRESMDTSTDQWNKSYETGVDQWDQTFQYQKDQDAIQNGQWLSSFKLTQSKNAADAAYKAKTLEWAKDPSNPDNVIKTLENAGASPAYVEAYDSVLDWLGEMTETYGQYGQKSGETNMYSESQLVSMLDGFPDLAPDEKIQLHDMIKGVIQ